MAGWRGASGRGWLGWLGLAGFGLALALALARPRWAWIWLWLGCGLDLGFDFLWISIYYGWILDGFWLDFAFRLLLVGFVAHSGLSVGSHSSLGGPRTCYEFLGLATALKGLATFCNFPP